MSAARRIGFTVPSLFLLAGTIVLLFLLLLAGAYDRKPLNQIFFLQADTHDIPNAPNGICHWTLYNYCDSRNGKNYNCRPNDAAYPFLPQRNFRTETNIPRDFIHNPRRYFYLSRFLYAFYVIDLFLALLAFFAALLATCFRPVGYLAAAVAAFGLFCMSFSAAIMTACYVLGQKAFRHNRRFARVGVKAFAFTWTCVALFFLSALMLALGLISRRNQNRTHPSRTRYSGSASRMRGSRHAPVENGYTEKEYVNKDNERSSYERMDGSGTRVGGRGVSGDASSQRRLNTEYQLNGPPTVK
ncbi:SUR7-domain-containing protein [Choiromyces venosus 120613-1]|uniref:SUR7-domain-containing protein n=1 Tax=Choiromyces venosus 120613-1 TaxID=1336337 RepID=A0A3N4JSW9_9PEZI|nr:SUR7-domain-containing protein [Choiromyces venosus 120613-1]